MNSVQVPALLETSPASHIRGAMLLVHGFNLKAAALDDYGKLVRSLGYHTVRVSLTGHDRERSPSASARAHLWRDDVAAGWNLLKQTYPELPLSWLGFSLGGALALDFFARHPEEKPQKLILIAPAIRLRLSSHLPRLLLPFASLGWTIPSLSPGQLLAHTHTSLHSYRALYEITDGARACLPGPKVPVLCIYDQRDRLVKPGRYGAAWTYVDVQAKPLPGFDTYHMLLGPEVCGAEAWEKIEASIRNFL